MAADGQTPLTWQHRLRIVLGVARALVHLHSREPPILHRRPHISKSVLLSEAGDAKLCNFGSTACEEPTENDNGEKTFAAGLQGMPPEFKISGHVSEKTDSYAFGIVLLEVSDTHSLHDAQTEYISHCCRW
jgi:serine/threonine protein kinase